MGLAQIRCEAKQESC